MFEFKFPIFLKILKIHKSKTLEQIFRYQLFAKKNNQKFENVPLVCY